MDQLTTKPSTTAQSAGDDLVIRIPSNKGRVLLGIVAWSIFFAIGVWLVIERPAFSKVPSEVSLIVGYVTAGTSAFTFVIWLIRLLDIRPALVLDAHGLLDRTTLLGIGRIAWRDVHGLRLMRGRPHKRFNWQRGPRVLALDVNDPEYYLRQAWLPARWLIMKPYRCTHGTPIIVQLFTVKIGEEELERRLEQTSGLTVEHQEHL